MKFSDLLTIHQGVKKAREMSLKSNHAKYRLGAVIMTKGRKVLAAAPNEGLKCHPYVQRNGVYPGTNGGIHISFTIHAELAAIFKVKNRENLVGATIFVYREQCGGNMANSRPCPMCYALIQKCGIKRIVYTTPEGLKEEKVVR